MERITKAIQKINEEIQKNPTDRYAALIGEHIIDCITTTEAAEKILTEKKTLKGALEEIKGKARKSALGGVAVIEDSEVYGWAREYFGIKEETKPKTAAINLEDFL